MAHGEHAPVAAGWQATRPHFDPEKQMRRLLLFLPLALAACSTPTMTDAPAMAPSASSALSKAGVEHSVTGSGLQDILPGFEYALEVSVHSDASGAVSGQIHVRVLDLTLFGLPAGTSELWEEPTCMRVVGNTAYIGAIVTKATDPATFPIGQPGIFWVRDGGPNGADVGHAGPSWGFDPTGLICTDTPPAGLPADAITHGNFIVR